jgi:hypothetical protein
MYPISFSKTKQDDYTKRLYQDRITPNVLFTRMNTGGPLFNYKPYENTEFTKDDLHNDMYYETENAQGGTIGVKWALLSAAGFPEDSLYINPDLFGTIGDPTHFYSFSQVITLIHYMYYGNKPVSLVSDTDYLWLLEDGSQDGIDPAGPLVQDKDLACYIPATNQYFKINITNWGQGNQNNQGTISYTRTALVPPTQVSVSRHRFALWPLYSDNTRVYYKPHSLTTGGGSTGVTNARLKRRKT